MFYIYYSCHVVDFTIDRWGLVLILCWHSFGLYTKGVYALSRGNHIFLFCEESIVQNVCALFFLHRIMDACLLKGPLPWSKHDFVIVFDSFSLNCYSGLGLRHAGFSIICSFASSEKYASKEVYLSVPGGLAGLPLFRTEPLTFIFMFLWTVLSVEFMYIWRVIFNSLSILASQSQT